MFKYYFLHDQFSGAPNCESAFRYIVQLKDKENPHLCLERECFCAHEIIPLPPINSKRDYTITIPGKPHIKFVKKVFYDLNIWEIENTKMVLFEKYIEKNFGNCKT